MYLDADTSRLTYEKPKKDATATYVADKREIDGPQFTYTFDKYTEILGPSRVKLFMSTQDKDDMDIYVIIRKLDVDGKILLNLNVPLKDQPHGTTFDDVDNLNL